MPNETNEFQQHMLNQVTRAKVTLRQDVYNAIRDVERFTESVELALGDVSIAEAKIAIIGVFVEKIKG